MRKIIWIVCTVLAVLLLAGVGVKLGSRHAMQESGAEKPPPGMVVAGAAVGGPFTLIDHHGKTVTERDFADRYKLIFFGFTYCPSVCPTELAKIADVMHRLGPRAARVTPLFVSVDPERDTPAILKPYVLQFDDRIIGLTGTRAQVEAMMRAYKVYAAKVPISGDDYTMDHSSFTYLMGSDDRLITMYRAEEKASEIAKDLQARLP